MSALLEPYAPLHVLKPFGEGLWIADGGVIVIKDNVVDTKDFDPGELEAGAYLVDYDDNSVIRKRPLLRAIFERCALKVIADAPSRLGRDDLHPVHAFALVPA